MTDKQPPEALRQAAWLKKEGASCQRHYDLGVLIECQHGELETLRAKLKTYEYLGDAADDVQLLRMGYAAARLEIESLHAQLEAIGAGGVEPLRGCAQAAPAAPAEGDALDTERLDWLTFNLSGKALRDIGVLWSEYGDARRAIDAAMAAARARLGIKP